MLSFHRLFIYLYLPEVKAFVISFVQELNILILSFLIKFLFVKIQLECVCFYDVIFDYVGTYYIITYYIHSKTV